MLDRTALVDGATVPEVLDRVAETARGDALVFPEERVSFAELAERTRLDAARLSALGVGPGDKVGILQHASIDFLSRMVGAMRVGAVPVPVNARYKSRELAYLIDHAELKVLFVGDDFVNVVGEALPSLDRVVGDDKLLPGMTSREEYESGSAPYATSTGPDDLAILLYTSGTTAQPKGCMHSHAALLHEGLNLGVRALRLRTDDVFWTPLPMFHVGGICTFMSSLIAECAFCHPGLFEPGLAVEQLATERCTIAFPAFETIWLAVLDHPTFADADLGDIRLVVNVGVPERLRAMQARLPLAPQVSAVGCTESAGFLSIGMPDDSLSDRVNTGGHVVPGMEVQLLDPETGEALPPGNTGELLFRGVSRLMGYYRDPEITAERIDADGWFHSGDLIRQDRDGRITFLSRLKDMLKVGGENVAPAEIEDHLATHPAVAIVAVVAAPDARYTEVPAAFVQLASGATATEQELIDHCIGKIATFKVPRYVRFVDEWPMSGTKVQKYKLRDQIADELAERGITEAPKIETS